jgi:hypothetical protein
MVTALIPALIGIQGFVFLPPRPLQMTASLPCHTQTSKYNVLVIYLLS